MKRASIVFTLSTMLFALSYSASAQQAGKIFRIGYLDSSTASGSAVLLDAFRQELSKLGWIEGKNIIIEYGFGEGKRDHLPELAADLVRLKVDLIVTAGDPRHRHITGTQRNQACGCSTEAKAGLEEIEAQSGPTGLENAFLIAKQKRVDAIMPTAATRFFAERKRIVDLAAKYRLPAIYFQREFVDEGGLMSYGVDYTDLFRRAAHYVDKILKGAKPADLPVQQATKFEFIINLKAAKQIGLTLSPDLLARANRVTK